VNIENLKEDGIKKIEKKIDLLDSDEE